jgi:peptidoglycan/xylan/chitin deacetylase (PgdA/CDA1 family)
VKNLLSVSTFILLGIVGGAYPALAWESWEHTFDPATGVELKKLGQDGANQYCRGRKEDLVKTGDLPWDARFANHVWAHLDANKCVYNK